MPKKPPPNAFYYYMKDCQEKMKAKGQQVPSMKELPTLAGPEWKRMTPEERAPYEQMVREFRSQRTNTDDGRLTSDGIPIQYLRQQEQDELEHVRTLESAVRTLVATLKTTNSIVPTSFYIMGFNILVGTLDKLYLPNEIGIVEYSIRHGIKKEYHNFIDPGPIPIGYTSEAKLFSETRHNIPICGFTLASNDYNGIYKDIRKFMGMGKQRQSETQYVFCHPDQLENNQLCLDWLKEHSGFQGPREIVFANLAVLVSEMKLAINDPYLYKSTAVDAITSNAFDFCENTRCEFHEELDNKNCALGYCKRLAFVLSDILCKPYKVEPTSNHFPERDYTFEKTTWQPAGPLRPVVNHISQPKPASYHVPTEIVSNVRSKLLEDESSTITHSAMSDRSSVVSESLYLDDDLSFPSLSDRMDTLSLASSTQRMTGNVSGPSWAQVSKSTPLRKPRSVPEDLLQKSPAAAAAPIMAPGIGRGAGIGRGRGSLVAKKAL